MTSEYLTKLRKQTVEKFDAYIKAEENLIMQGDGSRESYEKFAEAHKKFLQAMDEFNQAWQLHFGTSITK